jgi:hypothetical protein
VKDDEILRHRLISALLLVAPAAWAADNPMWRSGFTWSCTFSSVIRCERATDCESSGEGGKIEVAYRENLADRRRGESPMPIKRHYVQTVAGSPIGSEVKIELDTNEVIWLSPCRPGGDIFRQLDWRDAVTQSRRDRTGASTIDLYTTQLARQFCNLS